MIKYIVKRDGRKDKFNRRKIVSAIYKAFDEVDGEISNFAEEKANNISIYIETKINDDNDHEYSVEEIQDLVENGLMSTKRKDVARAYIRYRYERSLEREKKTPFIKEVGEKLTASNVQNQNANVDEHSFGGRMGEARNVLTKKYAIDYLLSPKVRFNHLHNRIYIHDLDSYASGMHNCLSVPIDKLLEKGFNTRQTDVRPARSIFTAMQLLAVIFQLQSLQQFGGVSATHLDWSMVPYVRLSLYKHYMMEYLKSTDDFDSLDLLSLSMEELDQWMDDHKKEYLEKLNLKEEDFYFGSDKLDKKLYKAALFETRKETYQAVESMYHNLNTLQSRSGY